MFLDFQEVRDIVVYYLIVISVYLLCSYIQDWRWPVSCCCLLLLLPILLPNESKLRRVACFLCFLLVAFISSPFLIFAFLFSPFHPQNVRYMECIESFLSGLFGISYEFYNLHNLNRYKKAIVIVNHQSVIDTFIVVKLWQYLANARVIVKRETLFFWPVGLAAWLCGVIFVEKMLGPQGRLNFLNQAKNHLNGPCERASILMFPEGKRNGNKKTLLPFKKGAFRLAAEMKIPIIPIVVSPFTFLDNNIMKKGKAIVTVLEPISEDRLANIDQLDDVMKSIWETMNRAYTRSSSSMDNGAR